MRPCSPAWVGLLLEADGKLGETLSEDNRLLLVAVALVELDCADIATKVRVRDDQLGTVLVCPFFYGF
jgi:hypothetical protein